MSRSHARKVQKQTGRRVLGTGPNLRIPRRDAASGLDVAFAVVTRWTGEVYEVVVASPDGGARILSPEDAMRYARCLMAVAERASHDAALMGQFQVMQVCLEDIARMIGQIRDARPVLPTEDMLPLEADPSVSIEGKPVIRVSAGGRAIGQWSPEDARKHALDVIMAVEAAVMDTSLYAYLTTTKDASGLTLEPDMARKLIGGLEDYRPQSADGIADGFL